MTPSEDSAALYTVMSVAESRQAHGRTASRLLWLVAALGVMLIWVIGIWPALFAACGIGALLGFMSALRRAHASSSWPVVPATVIEHQLHRSTSFTSTDGTSQTSPTFRPLATFEYSVDGEIYRGTNLESVSPTHDRAEAERALHEMWAVGSKHHIRVDPADPFIHTTDDENASAVLLREGWLVLLGLAFLGAAVFLYLS